jgi:hypothetical protein
MGKYVPAMLPSTSAMRTFAVPFKFLKFFKFFADGTGGYDVESGDSRYCHVG